TQCPNGTMSTTDPATGKQTCGTGTPTTNPNQPCTTPGVTTGCTPNIPPSTHPIPTWWCMQYKANNGTDYKGCKTTGNGGTNNRSLTQLYARTND
ncbi:MAG: hypothetical protein JWN00_5820, partial [Actinomycetia bacterium]|nr:hypothetical protein [Actinomycetes bacterium]